MFLLLFQQQMKTFKLCSKEASTILNRCKKKISFEVIRRRRVRSGFFKYTKILTTYSKTKGSQNLFALLPLCNHFPIDQFCRGKKEPKLLISLSDSFYYYRGGGGRKRLHQATSDLLDTLRDSKMMVNEWMK